MINYVTTLKQDVDKSLLEISCNAEMSMLKKASEVTILLEDAFSKLRSFILDYEFKDDKEEILFFKEIKPGFFCDLIFYRKVYNLEINRPTGGAMELKIYLENKLYRLKNFFEENTAFYRYYRSGETCRDRQYFMRGHSDNSVCLESFYYERDPQFSTCCDFKLAKVMANEKMEVYILEELANLAGKNEKQIPANFPKIKLTWTGKKIDLLEQIYGHHCTEVINFGKVSLNQLISYYEFMYNIDLSSTSDRAWYDLTIRQNPTSFIDLMRTKFRDRMNGEDNDNKNSKNNKKGRDKNNDKDNEVIG